MLSIFDEAGAQALISRINQLTPTSTPLWGLMNVGQMLAHCCKPFETIYDPTYWKRHPRPDVKQRFRNRLYIKPILINEEPYQKSAPSDPAFIISDERDFGVEQARLIAYVQKTHDAGVAKFEGKEAHSFGPMTTDEWSRMLYKHTDWHLGQFQV